MTITLIAECGSLSSFAVWCVQTTYSTLQMLLLMTTHVNKTSGTLPCPYTSVELSGHVLV